jgi:DNA-binding response OmpR family regulator
LSRITTWRCWISSYRTGLEILTALRQAGRPTLVLMLTVRHGESEVVAGLDAGADDYIGKPFSVVELVARVRALLRRRREPAGDILEFGGIRMDRAQRRVEIDGHAIQLTPREYELLEYLLRRPNRVVSRGELLERVWGIRFHPGTNVLDVHVSNVRRKLNAHAPRARIRTERGVGFALAVS